MNKLLPLVALISAAPFCDAGVNTWTATGPPGASVSAVRYLPGTGRVALAVTRFAIYRSTDDGENWTAVRRFDAAPDQFRRCAVAVNPQNGNQVLVVADSLYRSMDRGVTWTVTPVAGLTGTALAPNCVTFTSNGAVVWLATTQSRVYRSADAGATWILRNNGFPLLPTMPISQLEVDATNPSIVYARSESSVFRTLNDGVSWSLLAYQGEQPELVASRFTTGTLLRTSFFPGNTTDRSIDNGNTWGISSTDLIYGICYSQSTPGRAIGVNANTGAIAVTQNDGQAWGELAPMPMNSSNDFGFDPADDTHLLMAHYGGAFASSDGGLTWSQRNAGIPEAYLPTLYPTADSLYASATDFAGVYRRSATNGAWQQAANSAPAVLGASDSWNALAVSAQDSDHLFMVRNNDFGRSTDGGATWTRVGTFPSFALSLTWDPTSELVGYAITTNLGVLKTVDGGAHWAQLGNAASNAIDLVIDSANPNNLYLGIYQGNGSTIWRSTDAGLTWTSDQSVTAAVAAIVFKPQSSTILYAAASDGIYVTRDAGVIWTKLATLPADFQPARLAVDRNAPEMLYALDGRATPAPTSTRVIRSVDAGATWESLNYHDSWNNADAVALAVVPGERSTITVSRQNSGLFEMRIAPDLRVTAAGRMTVNTASSVVLTLTNGGGFSATNVRLTAELPAALGAYTVVGSGAACTINLRHLECVAGAVRPLMSFQATVDFTPTAIGSWQATAQAYEPDSDNANDTGTVNVIAPASNPPPAGGGGGGGRLDYLVLALLGALTLRGVIRKR